jgi:hypothetical protein
VVYFPKFVANGCLLRSTCVIDIWSRDVNISRLRTGRSVTGRVMFVRRHRSSTLVKKNKLYQKGSLRSVLTVILRLKVKVSSDLCDPQ